MQPTIRHILALSGGKDSTALAIYLRDRVPEMEYVFCDTHKELPETYDEHICIADVFVAQQDGGLPLESLANRGLAVRPRKPIAKRFLDWHRNNVYLGAAE